MSSKHSKNRSIQKTNHSTAIVHLYECNRLLNISRAMATEYSLDKRDMIATCRKNRQICENHGRYDLLPIWTLTEMIATPNVPLTESKLNKMLLSDDPFKKALLESLIMHYAAVGDLQTAVMLATLFHPLGSNNGVPGGNNVAACSSVCGSGHGHSKLPILTPNTSPYHTVLPIDTHVSLVTKTTNNSIQLRSNSWSDSLDCVDAKYLNCEPYATSLIRRAKVPLFDHFKRVYAEILYGWQLLTIRSLVGQ